MADVQQDNVQYIEQATVKLEEVSRAVREQKMRLIADRNYEVNKNKASKSV
jgi:hypothetical protein